MKNQSRVDVRTAVEMTRLVVIAAVLIMMLPAAGAQGALDEVGGRGGVTLAGKAPRQGILDDGFGQGGLVSTTFPSNVPPTLRQDAEVAAVALQPDGKIVAGGSGSGLIDLARYNADGTLDAGFGLGGLVSPAAPGAPEPTFSQLNALLVQPDGRILTAGSVRGGSRGLRTVDFSLSRFNPDGSPDLGFGNVGSVRMDLSGADDSAAALLLQPDGRIVAAGGAGGSLALARYEPDGSLDPNFGTGGVVTLAAAGGATALFVGPGGGCLAAATFGGRFALVGFTPDGSLDAAFGMDGIVVTDFEGPGDGVVLQADGRFVVLGAIQHKKSDFLLTRFNPDGSVDPFFGNHGSVETDFDDGEDSPGALLLQPDGNIVAAGSTYKPGHTERSFALARFTPKGKLDPKFGKSGRTTTGFSPFKKPSQLVQFAAGAQALALQPDGRLVAAGFLILTREVGQDRSFALARYF